MASVMVGLLALSSAFVIGKYLGAPPWVPPVAGLAVGAAFYVAADRVVARVRGWVEELAGAASPEYEYDDEEEYEEEQYDEEEAGEEIEGPEDEFLVYYFVSELARSMFRGLKRVRMEVEDGDAVFIYPEPSEDEMEGYQEFPEGLKEPAATNSDGVLTLRLPYKYFALLAEPMRRGDGEVADVRSAEELRAMYLVAKSIALSEIDDEGLASYTAYKALVKMIRQGRVSVPRELEELLPFESPDLRRKIREQVAEEARD